MTTSSFPGSLAHPRPADDSDGQSPDREHASGGIRMAKAVGIDLGTTNSVIAATEGAGNGHTERRGISGPRRRSWPSRRAANVCGSVGPPAVDLNPKGTISPAKRFIGRRFDEVSDESKAVGFDVVPVPDGVVRFDVKGKLYSPRGDQRLILRKLADDAAKFWARR